MMIYDLSIDDQPVNQEDMIGGPSLMGSNWKGAFAIRIIRHQHSQNILWKGNLDNYTGEKTKMEYKVDITDTPCHLGGVRYWFICPLRNCGRRVGKLYLPLGGKYFACRHCYDLTYRSCQEHSKKLDFFMRNPDIFAAHLKSKNPKTFCSAMLAYAKIIGGL